MLSPGQLVDGKYRVERLLGKGGMGAVFEGYHTLVDRRVAIKVLLPDATSSEHGAARFEREVRATGRIGNDHILEVYDVGMLPDGSRYMVSEFLDGETLADRLERGGPLQPKVAAELVLQLLDGLGAAHAKGIVHRDLKPENLFLLREKAGRADFLKIIDFGISKFQLDDMSAMSMTATGTVLGTPYYLSPEQARGHRDIDHRSDLYTVGVIMYQAVLGRVPVHAESFNELLFKIALESPPALKALLPQVDPPFSDIVERAMHRNRDERFQNAGEMREALAKWLELPTSGARVTGARVASPTGPAARGPWDSGETVTGSLLLPTNSNFGVSSARAFRRTSPVRIALIAVGVLGVLGVSAAVLLNRGAGDASVGSSAVSASALPAPPSASAPIVIAPADPPPLPEIDDSLPRAPEPETAPVDNGPLSGLKSRAELAAKRESMAPRPQQRPATTPVAPRAPATAAPAPASTASAKRRRDFGY